jgi:hypothetical protein
VTWWKAWDLIWTLCQAKISCSSIKLPFTTEKILWVIQCSNNINKNKLTSSNICHHSLALIAVPEHYCLKVCLSKFSEFGGWMIS